MIIEQIYTGCLAQGAYYIQSENEVAIIDPLREVQPYLDKARLAGATIKYVLETHFHADFVSGHVDLANKSGASIIYGPGANPAFEAIIARDGQEFKVGEAIIRVLHTPGHTKESTCYLLIDEKGRETALFSGDTLFIGDVGRPDLAQKAADMTQEDLAGTLFDSLRTKIMTLPGELIVYPAHGAGSACGKNMSKETSDTLAHQREVNYALRADMTRNEFIAEVTNGLTPPPAYFPLNVQMNRDGVESFDAVFSKGTRALTPDEFINAANLSGAVLLDSRDPQVFAQLFIPNSINIGIDGNFAPWVGTLIPDIRQEILIIAEKGREEEVVTRLARVGYDQAIGYLEGGMDAWTDAGKETDHIDSVSPAELEKIKLADPAIGILDVRKVSEYDAEHIRNSLNIPLEYINTSMGLLDKNKTYYVHCAGGYRSMIFNSLMRARGYSQLIDIHGGFKAIREAEFPDLTEFKCPSGLA